MMTGGEARDYFVLLALSYFTLHFGQQKKTVLPSAVLLLTFTSTGLPLMGQASAAKLAEAKARVARVMSVFMGREVKDVEA